MADQSNTTQQPQQPPAVGHGHGHGHGKPAAPTEPRKKTLPHAKRPRLSGHTEVSVPHLYDPSLPSLSLKVSNDDAQFELQPKYIGTTENPILYLNSQDPEWYKQHLPAPRFICWVINKAFLKISAAYAKRRLVEEAIKLNIQIVQINPRKVDLRYPNLSDPKYMFYDGKKVLKPHCALTRIGANIDYFGKSLVRHLERNGVRVFNNMDSLEISRDKLYTHQIICPGGAPVPKSLLCHFPIEVSEVERNFTYPVILKNTSGSLGEAVWKADNRLELVDLLNQMDKNKPLIFQEFIANSSGRDLRVYVVGSSVIAAMMRINPGGFKANIAQGGYARPIRIEGQLADLCVSITRMCKLDMAGIDVLVDRNTYKLCEVNASALFEGLERYTGINVAFKIMSYIADEMAKQ